MRRKSRAAVSIPAIHSRGQLMLQAALAKRGTAGKLAREPGFTVGTSMLNHLRTGRAPLPSLLTALMLEERLGIPCHAWIERPES
jgi:hypothetical protein